MTYSILESIGTDLIAEGRVHHTAVQNRHDDEILPAVLKSRFRICCRIPTVAYRIRDRYCQAFRKGDPRKLLRIIHRCPIRIVHLIQQRLRRIPVLRQILRRTHCRVDCTIPVQQLAEHLLKALCQSRDLPVTHRCDLFQVSQIVKAGGMIFIHPVWICRRLGCPEDEPRRFL